jgi:hypothetical protein
LQPGDPAQHLTSHFEQDSPDVVGGRHRSSVPHLPDVRLSGP